MTTDYWTVLTDDGPALVRSSDGAAAWFDDPDDAIEALAALESGAADESAWHWLPAGQRPHALPRCRRSAH